MGNSCWWSTRDQDPFGVWGVVPPNSGEELSDRREEKMILCGHGGSTGAAARLVRAKQQGASIESVGIDAWFEEERGLHARAVESVV